MRERDRRIEMMEQEASKSNTPAVIVEAARQANKKLDMIRDILSLDVDKFFVQVLPLKED